MHAKQNTEEFLLSFEKDFYFNSPVSLNDEINVDSLESISLLFGPVDSILFGKNTVSAKIRFK